MLRLARPGDEAAIEAFLARYAETSMFLRGNLANHGLTPSDAPRFTRYWLWGSPIEGVVAISNMHFVMLQAPYAPDPAYAAFAEALKGERVDGLNGEARQIARLRRALGIEELPMAMDNDEPLYRLDLDKLILPDQPGSLVRPTEAQRALITDWYFAYETELHMSPEEARTEAARMRADRALESDGTRLLLVGGTPVAMTSFNARLPDMVQIGGVYTPPELRGKGYARRVVALHLAEARTEGARTAILFASGPAACRAYEAIGFERIGEYALATLKEPVVIGAAS